MERATTYIQRLLLAALVTNAVSFIDKDFYMTPGDTRLIHIPESVNGTLTLLNDGVLGDLTLNVPAKLFLFERQPKKKPTQFTASYTVSAPNCTLATVLHLHKGSTVSVTGCYNNTDDGRDPIDLFVIEGSWWYCSQYCKWEPQTEHMHLWKQYKLRLRCDSQPELLWNEEFAPGNINTTNDYYFVVSSAPYGYTQVTVTLDIKMSEFDPHSSKNISYCEAFPNKTCNVPLPQESHDHYALVVVETPESSSEPQWYVKTQVKTGADPPSSHHGDGSSTTIWVYVVFGAGVLLTILLIIVSITAIVRKWRRRVRNRPPLRVLAAERDPLIRGIPRALVLSYHEEQQPGGDECMGGDRYEETESGMLSSSSCQAANF